MEADAKKAPGMPISTHTTATMETIILTARARMAGLPQQRAQRAFSKRNPIPRTVVM